MKTRILYTRFWHDNYISKLSIKEKLLFLYLTTNDKVNLCGIYELPDRYIKFDLGLRQSELDKIKQKFMEDGKFIFIDGWIKIINHDIYNKFVGEKNEVAKKKEMSLIPTKIKEFIYPIEGVSTDGDTLNNLNHNLNKKEGVVGGGKIIPKKKKKKKEISFDFSPGDFIIDKDDPSKKIEKKRFVNLTKEKIEELNKKYPDVDVDGINGELIRMEDWLMSEKEKKDNKKKNKIPTDYLRFIHNWLRKEQNKYNG